MLLALLVGGALSLTGATLQVLFRNPLAEPWTLGVSGGAASGHSWPRRFPPLHARSGPLTSTQALALLGRGRCHGDRLALRPARRRDDDAHAAAGRRDDQHHLGRPDDAADLLRFARSSSSRSIAG